MARTLAVTVQKSGKLGISLPADHPKKEWIIEKLGFLSPGYVEYLLQNKNQDPHCCNCGDKTCELAGSGNDACQGFRIGARW